MIDNSGKLAISLVVVAAFLAYVFMLFTVTVPPEASKAVDNAGGLLGAAFMAVVTYWVGSSIGSARKDETIRNQLDVPPTKPT